MEGGGRGIKSDAAWGDSSADGNFSAYLYLHQYIQIECTSHNLKLPSVDLLGLPRLFAYHPGKP